ncbi:hypothetical protein D048_4675 [Vibrio parahaemolyticus VPTS-2009]|nr:hypothetical protein D048_4675 [Vibrio parahaemolyticus VPTS-2009]
MHNWLRDPRIWITNADLPRNLEQIAKEINELSLKIALST